MKQIYQNYIGIDVSKQTLDICIRSTGETFCVTNNAAGIKRLRKCLQSSPDCLIVLEATGNYERLAVNQLYTAGFSVAVVNPRQVRDFAKASGRLAKTDRLDAAVLA